MISLKDKKIGELRTKVIYYGREMKDEWEYGILDEWRDLGYELYGEEEIRE